jgi:hypothetical protein
MAHRRVVFAAAVAALAAAGSAAARPPAAPTVAGPRETEAAAPVYRFRAAGAARFRCAFDTPRLHACKRRYSQRLAPGPHVLAVQAVSARGEPSRVTRVRVLVLEPPAPLSVSPAIPVGDGPGVPSVGEGAVWVPGTYDGTLTRVDPGGAVTGRFPVLPATPGSAEGFLDSAVAAFGSVWVASDFAARIARVDPASGSVRPRSRCPPARGASRPGPGASGRSTSSRPR